MSLLLLRSPIGVAASAPPADYGADDLGRAISEKLVTPGGGVLSFVKAGRQEDPDEAGTGHDRLLESAGLLLARAVTAQDKGLFQRAADHYRRSFRSSTGLSPWKLDPDDRPVRSADGSFSSAPIDELRIAAALAAGSAAFGESSYGDDAAAVARSLTAAVHDGLLTDDVSWDPEPPTPGDHVELSYLDTATMSLLARSEPSWQGVADRSIPLLKEAILPSGLPRQSYDPATRAYACGETCDTIAGLYSGLHLEAAGERETAGRVGRFYLDRLRHDGRLGDGYSVDGKASATEDLAAYALLARLAWRLGEADQAHNIVRTFILPQRQTSGPAAGLFSHTADDAGGFDNLEIVLTLGELNGHRAPAD